MIKGLFETHLYVADLEKSIKFYTEILGLQQCHLDKEREIAFFWIGTTKKAMLGLWQKDQSQIDKRHFAFECETEFVLNHSVDFLTSRDIIAYNFLNQKDVKPLVFAWMPALAIYFDDPDGHQLEFISLLEGNGNSELGVITYQQWIEIK